MASSVEVRGRFPCTYLPPALVNVPTQVGQVPYRTVPALGPPIDLPGTCRLIPSLHQHQNQTTNYQNFGFLRTSPIC
jgi:hypothetical protein